MDVFSLVRKYAVNCVNEELINKSELRGGICKLCVFVKEDVVQVSSSVRLVDCVSQKVTYVMVTMTVEITPMKEAVDTVNVTMIHYFRLQSVVEIAGLGEGLDGS